MSDEQLNRQQQLVKEYLDALLTDEENPYSVEAELDLAEETARSEVVEAPLTATELPKAGPEMEEVRLRHQF